MGKNNKKKRHLEQSAKTKVTTTTDNGMSGTRTKKQKATARLSNPLLEAQTRFMDRLTATERNCYFSNTLVQPERRAELWMEQADIGEALVSKYAWATPNQQALKILKYFSPLIEIGCGANAYWSRLMVQAGIDIVGYDRDPSGGGRIHKDKASTTTGFVVQKGGPEVLSEKKHATRTLFLCYPDENEGYDDRPEGNGNTTEKNPFSLGADCLEQYKGDYVIHVGELFCDPTLSLEQAPWGRSSSPEFQQSLAARFHCVLHVSLPNWLHTRDSLSVWKRSEVCTLVFAGDDNDSEDEDEEVHYRYVPVEEQLPNNVAAPCLQHLLASETQREVMLNVPGKKKESQEAQTMPDSGSRFAKKKRKEDYECPW